MWLRSDAGTNGALGGLGYATSHRFVVRGSLNRRPHGYHILVMGKVPGESYAPSPMFFDILACLIVNVGHATSRPMLLCYPSEAPDVLEDSADSGEQVQSPTPAYTLSLTAFQVPHTHQTHCRRG